jgi:phosphoribosylformimino-5-aminoimidazole carboxamide ribotide isomerase
MLSGPAFELYAEILDALPDVYIIASGGISSMEDILRLDEMGVPGVIVGKAIYEGKIQLTDIKRFLN